MARSDLENYLGGYAGHGFYAVERTAPRQTDARIVKPHDLLVAGKRLDERRIPIVHCGSETRKED
jgi:hypothetical protein